MEPSEHITRFFAPDPPTRLGVAVSGGSDSVALLALLNDWRKAGGPALHAVTVDHGLRAEAAAEADDVAKLCAEWDIPHTTLNWRGWDGTGNLPDRARRARYALMAAWAAGEGIPAIALGHTADDQAETFLMRLAREAGLDGLAEMVHGWDQDGVRFVRPVLGVTRAALREFLAARGVRWTDDPSNTDDAYERSRARKALAGLAPLGISAETLANVSRHLGQAREALEAQVAEAARDVARVETGDVVLDRARFAALPPETARRLFIEALMWISGAEYPPRGATLLRAMERALEGKGTTLHGCRVTTNQRSLRITREENAVAGHSVPPGEVWDGRWRVTGPEEEGVEIRALGTDGLKSCREREKTFLPAATLRASPAVWRGDTLVAAPLAGRANGWQAVILRRENHDFAALISH